MLGERVVEFTFPDGRGGLISLRQTAKGPHVEVYRMDEGISVAVSTKDRRIL
jgi:hypothetical protein